MSTPPIPQSIKLTYFDIHGGRGEAARIALSIRGIPFEDDRIQRGRWAELKPTMPLRQLPVLEVEGKRITQSNAINRYVGRLAGLYPDDPWQAAIADEACDAVEAFFAVLAPTYHIEDAAEMQRARAAIVDEPLPLYMGALAGMLAERGGEWFADNRLTVADLKVRECIRYLTIGTLDHIPQDLVGRLQPTLVEHLERVMRHPGVRAYYERVGA